MRKYFYLLIMYLAGQYLFAQSVVAQTDPLRQKLDLVFANINKSQIPTGFLEEYGSPLLPLDVFNGVLSDSNKVNIDVWRQAYTTLYTSRIYGVNPLTTIASVNTTISSLEAIHNTQSYVSDPASVSGSIPVAMFYAPYNYLRPDALSSNLLSVTNEQLYDVAGRTQSPYYSRIGFAATPTAAHARGGIVSLIFKPELFYNTSNKVISSINIDFADGRGYLTALWNNPIVSNYTTAGTKNIKIKLAFTDNSVVECYSILEIAEVNISNPQARYSGIPSIPPVPFNATANHSGGWLYIEYDENDAERTLNKPLIVLEGFDAHKVAPKLQEFNYSFGNLARDINVNFISGQNLITQLDNIAGYDLVFLDYNEGTDDIRRNAALVQQVIDWVNANKVGTEQNVVMGISMGGLVARYALANMTKQGLNTQTRLLITHDSPHRGANTPLGFQFLTRQLNDVFVIQMLNLFGAFPQLTQANQLLDEPASKQMSIVRAVNESGGVSYNTFLDGDYRNMITFPVSGPQPSYRVIATSLGSECGQQNLSPSTELLRTNGRFFISPVPWIIRRSYNAEIIVNALPSYGQSKRISKVRIWVNYKILSFISISINYTNKEAYSPTNLLPWDAAPGGSQSVESQAGNLPSANYRWLAFFELSLNTTVYPGTFCFVPTVSALDVTTLDAAALSKSYVDGISPTNPSRFATFIAQERIGSSNNFNESHPRLTARNAQWIFSEMENIAHSLTCSPECPTVFDTPSGVGTLCTTNSSFSLGTIPSGATVAWSATPANYFVTSTGTGSTAVLRGTSSARGQGTLTFTITSLCRTTQVTKTLWVGKPMIDGSYNGQLLRFMLPDEDVIPYNLVCNGYYTTCQMSFGGSTSGSWQKVSSNPSSLSWSQSGNNLNFYFWAVGQTSSYRLTTSNTCGTTTNYYYFKSIDCSGGGGDPCNQQYSVSPNPSSNFINIVVPNVPPPCESLMATSQQVEQTENKLTIQSISLYNSEGLQKRSQQFSGDTKNVVLDVTDLHKGVYILIVSDGVYTETHRIIIKD